MLAEDVDGVVTRAARHWDFAVSASPAPASPRSRWRVGRSGRAQLPAFEAQQKRSAGAAVRGLCVAITM